MFTTVETKLARIAQMSKELKANKASEKTNKKVKIVSFYKN